MSITVVGVVLLSTILHALWNGWCKLAPDKRLFNVWLIIWAAISAAPLGLWALADGAQFDARGLLAAATTALLWVGTYEALARAYDAGDLSVMYPITKGATPLIAAVLALATESWPTPLGWLGLVLVGLAVWLAADSRAGATSRPAVVAALIVAGFTAAYSVVDHYGVSRMDARLYQFTENCFGAVALAVANARRYGWAAIGRYGRAELKMVAWSGTFSVLAYALVLWAYTQAPTAYVAALRAAAILWSVLYGGLVLREPALRARLGYAGLMVLGLVLLAVWGRP